MATNLTQTTLAAAITSKSTTITVVSATNISAPVNNFFQKIYVLDLGTLYGELMSVQAVNGTAVSVSRLDEYKAPHLSGALVLIQNIDETQPAVFITDDVWGAQQLSYPTNSQLINVRNGKQWLYSTVTNTWVPGWGNFSAPAAPTAPVASAAGLVTPSGPLFHITGGAAITGFNLPVGFTSGSFTVIPDGTFTWTTATNIALAGTAVVGAAITFTYDPVTALFYPNGYY